MNNVTNPQYTEFMTDTAGIKSLTDRIAAVKAVLLGDLCLDVYWSADMTKSRLSRETAHFPLPIVGERFSPGAGANVANCMSALKPASLEVIGVFGDDWRGGILKELLEKDPVIGTGCAVTSSGVCTNAYCKPMRFGYSGEATEDPRLDFENRFPLPKDVEERIISSLDKAVAGANVLTVCDQLEYGCVTENVRERITRYAREGLLVLVDSRERIELFRHAVIKPNERECAEALGMRGDALGAVAKPEDAAAAANALAERSSSSVCLTLGERGSLYANGKDWSAIPAVRRSGPTDTVGAGDTYLSALSLALAAGADSVSACSLAALASGVTVGKTGMTGTANASEILALAEELK